MNILDELFASFDLNIWKPTCPFCGFRTINDTADVLKQHILYHSETYRINPSFFTHVNLKPFQKVVSVKKSKKTVVQKRFFSLNLSVTAKKKFFAKDAINQPILFTDPIITKDLIYKQLHRLKSPLFTNFTNCIDDVKHLPLEWQKYFVFNKLVLELTWKENGEFLTFKCPDCRVQTIGANFFSSVFQALCHLLKVCKHRKKFSEELSNLFLEEWKNFTQTFNISILLERPKLNYSILIFDDFLLKGAERQLVDEMLSPRRACSRKYFVYFCAKCLQSFAHGVNFVEHCATFHNVKMYLKFFGVEKNRLMSGTPEPISLHWFPFLYVMGRQTDIYQRQFEWTCCECKLFIKEQNIFAIMLKALLHFYFEIYIVYCSMPCRWPELCLFMNTLELKFRTTNDLILYANHIDICVCDFMLFLTENELNDEIIATQIKTNEMDFSYVLAETKKNFSDLICQQSAKTTNSENVFSTPTQRSQLKQRNALKSKMICKTNVQTDELERFKLRFCLNCEMVFLLDSLKENSTKSGVDNFEQHAKICNSKNNNQEDSPFCVNRKTVLLRKLLCDVKRAVCSRKAFLLAANTVRRQPAKLATKNVQILRILAMKDLTMFEMPPSKLVQQIYKKRVMMAEKICNVDQTIENVGLQDSTSRVNSFVSVNDSLPKQKKLGCGNNIEQSLTPDLFFETSNESQPSSSGITLSRKRKKVNSKIDFKQNSIPVLALETLTPRLRRSARLNK